MSANLRRLEPVLKAPLAPQIFLGGKIRFKVPQTCRSFSEEI
jgi:hypothetical protein